METIYLACSKMVLIHLLTMLHQFFFLYGYHTVSFYTVSFYTVPVPQKYKSDLVYKCTCPHTDCNELYIGETERRFEERIIDHNKRDKKSHIYKHSGENSHPHVWLDNFEIVGRNYGNRTKRKKIGEALLINELKPSLNKQDKSFPLKPFN